jgi:uncharacterized SAM-binding protein YcdF (DUF218 family)
VLGGGLLADGRAHPATVRRAERAAALAQLDPRLAAIVSGSSGGWDDPRPRRSEAALMRDVMVARGTAPDRVFEEDESRDTVGNAVLVRLRYLDGLAPRPLAVVTSPFHLERATAVFRHVLGPAWLVRGEPAADGPDDEPRRLREPTFLAETERLLAGTAPGDIDAVAGRLRDRYPYYAQLPRLAPGRAAR